MFQLPYQRHHNNYWHKFGTKIVFNHWPACATNGPGYQGLIEYLQ